MMKQNNYLKQELNLIILERATRILANALSIKYKNKYYVPVDSNTEEVVSYMKKMNVLFCSSNNILYYG